jgi:hypothetical protein
MRDLWLPRPLHVDGRLRLGKQCIELSIIEIEKGERGVKEGNYVSTESETGAAGCQLGGVMVLRERGLKWDRERTASSDVQASNRSFLA